MKDKQVLLRRKKMFRVSNHISQQPNCLPPKISIFTSTNNNNLKWPKKPKHSPSRPKSTSYYHSSSTYVFNFFSLSLVSDSVFSARVFYGDRARSLRVRNAFSNSERNFLLRSSFLDRIRLFTELTNPLLRSRCHSWQNKQTFYSNKEIFLRELIRLARWSDRFCSLCLWKD